MIINLSTISILISTSQNILLVTKIINILIIIALLSIISLLYYFIHKRIRNKKPQKLPAKLAIRNIVIIVLCFAILAVSVTYAMDFSRHQATNVFEEMYNDYTLNHSELFSYIPVFRTTDEFLWDGFSGMDTTIFMYDCENSRRYRLEQAGIEIETQLEENEQIFIRLYKEPKQIEFVHQITDGTSIHITSYVYDCRSKTLTYATDTPANSNDTFLEDRILAAWFKYSQKDSLATHVVRKNQNLNYYTKFSPTNWGDVTMNTPSGWEDKETYDVTQRLCL